MCGKFKLFPSSLVLLAAILVAAGCAQPPVSPHARITPRIPVAIEAQSRLLQNARTHYAEGRYLIAANVLRHLIDTYPESQFLLEARWWLARSYEQLGDLKNALTQYRAIADPAETTILGEESDRLTARRRIAELEQLLGPSAVSSNGLTAILIPSQHLSTIPDLDHWMQSLTQAGITTLVLEVGTRHTTEQGIKQRSKSAARRQTHAPTGVYFRTGRANLIQDFIGQTVPVAHRHGLSVFGAITLRRMSWLESRPEWADWLYDPARRQLKLSSSLDLFNPAFQEYLTGFLTDLADTGIDGVLFRADVPIGPTDGLSSYGLAGFERDFGIRLDPGKLLPRTDPGTSASRQEHPPEFWRWAGWKARETLKVIDQLRRAMRQHSPRLQFALEVHPEAVTAPVETLMQYAEDLLEAKRSRFDSYLIGVQHAAMPNTVERLIELLGGADRIWVTASLPEGDLARLGDRLKPTTDRASLAKGIGVMYANTSSSVP
ncbi:MAG: tetratricopeptide repeat protein [Nitrospiraceae bacterium]